MRIKKINVPIYEFEIMLYQLEDIEDADAITKALKKVGLTDMVPEVTENLTNEVVEGGFTCFNGPAKLLIVVLYPTDGGDIYVATLDHEKRHCVDNMLEWVGVNDHEAAAYLSGWLTTKFKV